MFNDTISIQTNAPSILSDGHTQLVEEEIPEEITFNKSVVFADVEEIGEEYEAFEEEQESHISALQELSKPETRPISAPVTKVVDYLF